MALLLSYKEQQTIKPISDNNSDKYPTIAAEVEDLELRKLLGTLLLQDVQTNPTSTYNAKLLAGDVLTTGERHKGLKYVIAYLNYSRYAGESHYKDTYTGFKKQKNEESDFLSEGEIKRIQNLNREIAMSAWELIADWLNENSANFTYWNAANERKVYTPKIYGVRKTYR